MISTAKNPKDWPEDFALENGRYFCKCCHCGSLFTGHKRRVVCRECDQREHIGYIEREEGFYKLYSPVLKDSITTNNAPILCKYCEKVISESMGPKCDAVCFECYEKEPELR